MSVDEAGSHARQRIERLCEFGFGEVRQWRPEVLALDARLPGMIGYDRST